MQFHYTMYWDKNEQFTPATTKIDIEGYSSEDYIENKIRFRKMFFEDDLLEYLAVRGPRGGVFIDIGANIGNHSVYFGKFLADYIISIEPHPKLLPILKRNLDVNRIIEYSIIPYAVGAKSSAGYMSLRQGYEKNIGGSHVSIIEENSKNTDSDSIIVTTIDNIIESLENKLKSKQISFIKIDIEGMELEALKGATNLLEKHHPQLAIELISLESLSAVKAFLKNFGYIDVGKFCSAPTYHFINPSIHELRSDWWSFEYSNMNRLRLASNEINVSIPPGHSFILVDENNFPAEIVTGRCPIPFLEKDGQYWGAPADDETAIREVERLQQAGAGFIVFAWNTFWWLEYYSEFNKYLRSKFRCELENDRLVIFDLKIY